MVSEIDVVILLGCRPRKCPVPAIVAVAQWNRSQLRRNTSQNSKGNAGFKSKPKYTYSPLLAEGWSSSPRLSHATHSAVLRLQRFFESCLLARRHRKFRMSVPQNRPGRQFLARSPAAMSAKNSSDELPCLPHQHNQHGRGSLDG